MSSFCFFSGASSSNLIILISRCSFLGLVDTFMGKRVWLNEAIAFAHLKEFLMKTNNKTFQKLQSFRPYYFFSVTVFLTTSQTETISSLQSSFNSLNKWLNNSENINYWLINILLIFIPLSVLVSGLVFKNALDQGDQESVEEAQKTVAIIFLTLIMLVVSFFVVFA